MLEMSDPKVYEPYDESALAVLFLKETSGSIGGGGTTSGARKGRD